MSFSFFKNKKSPPELVKSVQSSITSLLEATSEPKTYQKVNSKISSSLSDMKVMLYGDGENDPKPELTDSLVESLFASDLPLALLKNMQSFDFEARKDVAQILNFALRQKRAESVEYVQRNPEVLHLLVQGYREFEIALNCGSILRECIRHQALCEMILNNDELFNPFFEYVQMSTFDVASDAFATFKLLLTKHKKSLVADFLNTNFDSVFERYNVLLESRNYVTKRQSLKLLGELLLDRINYKAMIKYINAPQNLKILMNLLRGTTKAIQTEAFHVFKIFVANPNKSKPIVEILHLNRDKLIEFLKKLQADKDNAQFEEEKKILLLALEQLDTSVLDEKPKE